MSVGMPESIVWTLPSITRLSEWMSTAKRRIFLITTIFASSKIKSDENLNLVREAERFRFSPDQPFDLAKLLGIKIILLFAAPINSDNCVIEGKLHTTDSGMPTTT